MSQKKQSSVMAEVKEVIIRHANEIQSLATVQHKKFLGGKKFRSEYIEKYQKNHILALKYISQNLHKKNFASAIKIFQKMGESIGKDAIRDGLTIEESADGMIFLKQAVWCTIESTGILNRMSAKEFYDISQAIGTYCDIISSKITFTYHKMSSHMEEELAKVDQMVELSEDAIISLDMKGRITSWNSGAKRIYGYSGKEIMGKPLTILIPENRKDDFPMIIRQLKSGKRVDHYITQRLTKNKRIVDVSISFSPIRDKSGKLIGASKIARDITESIRIRNQLAHHASLVESSSDSIWSIDRSGKIVSWNKGAEELYGYEKNEVLGKTPDSIIALEYLNEFHELAHKLWNGETVENYDSARVRKDGSRVEVSVSMSPIKNSLGETEGISVVARNITERKKLEQRKDDFIALASHELKTPVTSLKMFTQVLEARFKKSGDFSSARYMESMDNQINKLTEIVNGLLDVSRVSQGKLTYKKEPFSIKQLVKETIESMQLITNTHRIEVSGNTNKQIIGDKDRIEQVLINLINNAVKYSPKARKVVVELKNQNGGVLVSVTDFGMGIPKRDETRVFDRFFQADTPLVKTYPGLGLGLYISKEIVNRHGGKLWVKSIEGKGSTFYVLLPAAN